LPQINWQKIDCAIRTVANKSKASFNATEELGAYIHYDLRNEKPIRFVSSSSFTPFAGIPTNERAATIIQTMMTKFEERYVPASL
jgi:neutral trehalase